MRGRAGALALLTLLGIGWGLHIVLSKALGAETPVAALAFLVLYMAGTAGGLVAAMVVRGRIVRPARRHGRFFLISATLGYLAPIGIELNVAPRLDSSLFTLIAALSPLLTVAIAVPVGQDRLSGRLALALASGSAATAILLVPDAVLPPGADYLWVFAAFLLPLSYAVDNVYVAAAWPREFDTLQVSAIESLVGLGLASAAAFLAGVGAHDVAAAARDGGVTLAALVVVSIVTVWLYFHLLRTDGAVFVSFAGFVALATGVLCGVLFFGERPTAALWTACGLTVLALSMLHGTGGHEREQA